MKQYMNESSLNFELWISSETFFFLLKCQTQKKVCPLLVTSLLTLWGYSSVVKKHQVNINNNNNKKTPKCFGKEWRWPLTFVVFWSWGDEDDGPDYSPVSPEWQRWWWWWQWRTLKVTVTFKLSQSTWGQPTQPASLPLGVTLSPMVRSGLNHI